MDKNIVLSDEELELLITSLHCVDEHNYNAYTTTYIPWSEAKELKDPKTRDEILDFMYENFDADDVTIFNSINNIMDNVKCLEFEM